MIVPARRRFFDAGRFANGVLKVGETFSIDSHMGGSWTVVFMGYDERGHLTFKRERRPDWPATEWTFASPANAAKELFILGPENPHLNRRDAKGGAR